MVLGSCLVVGGSEWLLEHVVVVVVVVVVGVGVGVGVGVVGVVSMLMLARVATFLRGYGSGGAWVVVGGSWE